MHDRLLELFWSVDALDRKGLEGYRPNTGSLDYCRWGILVGMGTLGRRACFHAHCLFDPADSDMQQSNIRPSLARSYPALASLFQVSPPFQNQRAQPLPLQEVPLEWRKGGISLAREWRMCGIIATDGGRGQVVG